MTTAIHRDLLEGGPLVMARPQSRPGRSLACVELDQTQMRRVAKAALLLAERSGSRAKAAEEHGFAASTISGLIRMDQPWVVGVAVLEHMEAALGLRSGDVLAGRAPEPVGQVGRTNRRCR